MRGDSYTIGRVALLLLIPPILPCLAKGQAQSSPNCQTIAAPPPLATFGGPATMAPGETELGLAVGAAGNIYPLPCGHEGFSDWLVRWRRGVSNRIDLGFDFEVENHSGGDVGGTVKVAMRYQVTRGFRLEGGVGASDTGLGRSVNADLAATIGTSRSDRTWNYYASLRVAGSRGCANLLCGPGNDVGHPPGALIPLGVIGATARVSDNVRFVLEAGQGGILSRQHPDPGGYINVSFGVLFDVGKKHHGGG